MELSIIVPVYNMAADGKLEYCLNSLVNQTITDYEIIAVDDASTDNSPQILLDYAANYPDLVKVYFSPENRKQGGAKNIGLKHARGRWIGFIDSDDWTTPDMYEKLLKKAKETGADMVACNYHLTYEHSGAIGQEVRTHYEAQTGVLDEDKYKLLILDSGSLVIKIYRRSLIYDCGMQFPEHIFYEDNAIANAIVLKAKHFEYIDEPLYAYYQHAASTVHTISMERCEHRMEAARIMLKHAKDFDYLEKYHDEIEFKFTVLFYVNTLFSYLQGVGKKDIAFLSSMQKEMKITFPNFEENPYYKARIGEEERMFIHMQQKSTRWMLAWYEFKWFVRRLRKEGLKSLVLKTFGTMLGVSGCLLLTWFAIRDPRTLEYPVVLMGDSIVANDFAGDEINRMLAEKLGEDVFNAGFGGSFLSNPNIDFYDTGGDESLSMEVLAQSIVTGDFTPQKASFKRFAKLDYFQNRLETLSQIDFNKTHTLIMEHGVNDYVLQIPPARVGEALREIIISLKKQYPKLRIVVASPTYCYILIEGEPMYCDSTDLGPYLLEDYVLEEERVCEELGVTFIDNYHQEVITKETIENYSLDGLHLNEAGRQFMADAILDALRQDD